MTNVEDDRFHGLVVVPESDLARVVDRGEHAETLEGLRGKLRRALAPELEIAEPLAVRITLASVAPQVALDDPRLGVMARRGGRAWLRLVDAMDDAIGSLIGREEALAIVSRGEDSVALRARLLSRLSLSLDRALSAVGLVDPRREAERVAERVARAEPQAVLDVIGARDVRARGIVEWTPTDLALWRVLDATLSRVGGRASIELPVFDRPLDAERERDPLDTLIEAVASALDDAPLTESITMTLGDLRMRRGDRPSLDVPVEVRRADGKEAQGRAVADAVHAALEDGASPGSVLVGMVSEDDGSVFQILRALEELGIPASDVRRARAPRSSLLALADAALDVAARGAERLDVARLLRSSYVDARVVMNDANGESASRALRALARCLEETPSANGAAPGEHLAATVASSTDLGLELRSRLVQRVAQLGASLARIATPANRAEHAARSRALYRDLGLAATPTTATLRESRIARADRIARSRDADAWEHLFETLEVYERATVRLGLVKDDVTLETFRHEVAWGLAKKSPSHPPASGTVRIHSFSDLPREDSSLVVVADADSDSWPDGRAVARLVPPLLEDRLLRVGDPALRPLLVAGSAQVLARLAQGTSRARRAVLTYRTHDEQCGSLSPAPIVAWLARSAAVSSFRPTTTLSRPRSDRERVLHDLAENPSRAVHLAPDVARRATLERRREEAFGFPLADRHPLVATLPRGPLFEAILADETGGGARPLSASAVDRLASCVFQGFVSEVLRPRRRLGAHDVADAREEGNITHAGLEAAFRATTALWSARPRDRDAIRRMGLAAADAALERHVASELARTVAARVRAGVRAVLEWSIADEEWDFARAEQSFGEEEGWKALVLEHGGARVAIKGRIDRIDVAHRPAGRTSLRVIDYKGRATTAESYTARFGSTTFQLALYGRVATQALERAAAAGLYLGTQRLRPGDAPKKHLERWNDAHTVEQGVARFERTVVGRVLEIRTGKVEVRPYDESSCERCDYEGVCRKPRFAPSLPGDDEAPIEDES